MIQEPEAPFADIERREVGDEYFRPVHYWCRIVSDEDGARIPAVHAQLLMRTEPPAPFGSVDLLSDAEGLVELTAAWWLDCALLVEVEGFARGFVPIEAGHATKERAFELRLRRCARLLVQVHDPHLTPVPAVTVHARVADVVQSASDFWLDDAHQSRAQFEALTDKDGRATLNDLPPGVELEIEVLRDGVPMMRDDRTHSLEPGEERELALSVGGRASLRGRVLDQSGAAVESIELWLVEPDQDMEATFRRSTKPRAKAWTNAEGAFEFADIAEGEWWVGPGREWHPPHDPLALAAVGQRVVIPPGEGPCEVVLRVWRGIYLRGRVQEINGKPAPRCRVFAKATTAECSGQFSTTTSDSGVFELGPVCGVEYALTAGGFFESDFAESASLDANGGSDNIALFVERGARLRGVVIDADTGEACFAEVSLTQANIHDGFARGAETETSGGAFEITGIGAGEWDVFACTRLTPTERWEFMFSGMDAQDPDQRAVEWEKFASAHRERVATARVTLIAGETKKITLQVAASAALEFKNTSTDAAFHVQPQCNGIALKACDIEARQQVRLDVPPGQIELRILDAQGKTLVVRTLEIASGATGLVSYP